MTNGFSNDRPQEDQPCGFLPYRLGKKIIYCNRPTPDVLWYERINNENIKIEALSFVSKTGGLVSLEIYATERYEEIKWKMGLLLRGPHDQVFHFECGIDTVFAKGMMWGFCAAEEAELRSGKIGLLPMPADPNKSKSKNPDKILYCNLFLNGRELPYFPGGTEHDWRAMAIIAMRKCNGYEPDPESIPSNDIFMDEKATEKYNKKYGSQPATKTTQPARQTSQPAQSGRTYPNQPFRGQPAPANRPIANHEEAMALLNKETEGTRQRLQEQQETIDEGNQLYDQLLDYLNDQYKNHGYEIDRDRLNKVVARGQVSTFQELSLPRKHQIIATFCRELIALKHPEHPALKQLDEIVTPTPFTPEAYTLLDSIMQEVLEGLLPF